MAPTSSFFSFAILATLATALRFSHDQVQFNLNENASATHPLDYHGHWPDHTYHPSPQNWRMPTYTTFLDRFANGDPTNDNANGTRFEQDLLSNQLRHGGDVKGIHDSLDYLQGMGIKNIYLAGSPFINNPWGSDGYSPLDLTLLDHHFGDISAWRSFIDDLHSRGMYLIMDNTFGTLGDLLGFQGHLDAPAPFLPEEYDVLWKSDRRYDDFAPGNASLETCEYPRFWGPDGRPVVPKFVHENTCRDSEFDQYGGDQTPDTVQPVELQLLKFVSVQDRLREWREDVLAKIKHFSCLQIAMLDIDGFRIDKATQVTLDALADWSASMRQCAATYNKTNLYIAGEISTSNAFGSLYIGRGAEPEMAIQDLTEAVSPDAKRAYIHKTGKSALDGAAFHYSVYRGLERFLGLDGNYTAIGDPSPDFIETWNTLLRTNDMENAYTGEFDPRHMFGVSNQDVFRWPAITDGTQKQLLGHFITTLLLPGIPTIYHGEEQAFYILENEKANYVFGRQAMSSSLAWQLHGCYQVGVTGYENFPLDAALRGCTDDAVSLDHRDPSHTVRNVIKRMFELRDQYPVLNDGWSVQQLSKHTHNIFLPGSNHTPTETGLWSAYRSIWPGVQELPVSDQGVWLLYSNEDHEIKYNFNCGGQDGILAPFEQGTVVRNLFSPYEEYTLTGKSIVNPLNGSCLSTLKMPAFGFKALVPAAVFESPRPALTEFHPGHDARILSEQDIGEKVHIKLGFSEAMGCSSIAAAVTVDSSTTGGVSASLDPASAKCRSITLEQPHLVGGVATSYVFEAELVNVHHGVHKIRIDKPMSLDLTTTKSVDHLIFRLGSKHNPLVFPRTANYSSSVLQTEGDLLSINHEAPGADLWRYSMDFGDTYSNWLPYTSNKTIVPPSSKSGPSWQSWKGQHVQVQYFSKKAGSSSHYVYGDVDSRPRRFPNVFVEGPLNQFGADRGIANELILVDNGTWALDFMADWPTEISLNARGLDSNGKLDITQVFGDVDSDGVLDRIAPESLLANVISIGGPPARGSLGFTLKLNDGNLHYQLQPTGSQLYQIIIYFLLGLVPVITGFATVWAYEGAYYRVKFNMFGISANSSLLSRLDCFSGMGTLLPFSRKKSSKYVLIDKPLKEAHEFELQRSASPSINGADINAGLVLPVKPRKTVLIATMEYDIEDWEIKVKIGGLGVMAQLMGKSLGHQNLIWVVPCVGGIDYPEVSEEMAQDMEVIVLDETYQVSVRTHVLRNITYVLLDAPVFRKQTKSEPYPPRMDDLDSAIFYSAWNQCIAETIRRYAPDLYHINDYHGCVAPLYLLPKTIPCALSLHNAEFQGLWPMRNAEETEEVCNIYNLSASVVKKYIQFGEVFNLLHAGASVLRIHQDGFGAVGVSKKYGKRSWARYPIFWGLKEIGSLPNPDPSDTAEWHEEDSTKPEKKIQVDRRFEAERIDFRMQAQKWAGLKIDPSAELFVFVGRWSEQKGVDLIADLFPSVLKKHPKTQLICIGPTIDLYGKLAALKLARLMELFPGRVYSKPEFTALPPYIFQGAEFALIPSRDEPFGLVAVEFGRKGALGVGARVGGLGQMPGWWYTVESTTSKHLLHQFSKAIEDALACPTKTRAKLRARSAKQRFPVAQWVQDLETLQTMAIEKHGQHSQETPRPLLPAAFRISRSGMPEEVSRRSRSPSPVPSHSSREEPRSRSPSSVSRPFSGASAIRRMGSRRGPGHIEDDSARPSSEEQSDDYRSPDFSPDIRAQDMASPPLHLQTLDSRWLVPELSTIPPTPQEPIAANQRRSRASMAPELADIQDRGLLSAPHSRSPSPDPSSRYQHRNSSTLSLDGVIGGYQDFELQKVPSSFTDSNGEYRKAFENMLQDLSSNNSQETGIEEYLQKSEKDYFRRYKDVRLGRSKRAWSSIFRYRDHSPAGSSTAYDPGEDGMDDSDDQFLLEHNYKPPTGIKRWMTYSIGEWPAYSLLLALGQILAANSYQITLLTGDANESSNKLYIISAVYIVTSILWWSLFRTVRSVYVLSTPFGLYGFAFFLVGIASVTKGQLGKAWVINIATGFYTIASSSGSLFFALNFGDQGGSPTKTFIFRACVIQGTQSVYITGLWLWGSTLTKLSDNGTQISNLVIASPAVVLSVGGVLCLLMFTIAIALMIGLPDYYRQSPSSIPSFIPSILRRKIVLWFFALVVAQNFFLSAPYARNWLYLYSSQHVSVGWIILLALAFFILVWVAWLTLFHHLSKTHPWILPMFAIGLGAPRWCQLLWSTSGIGLYLPWASAAGTNLAASAIAGRALWLWLGVLDALQGVGFGMILLQTLTRFHVAFTLITAQVLGAAATILAKGVAPNRLGPGSVFPNFGLVGAGGLGSASFWIALMSQLIIGNLVAVKFFRREQLSKP